MIPIQELEERHLTVLRKILDYYMLGMIKGYPIDVEDEEARGFLIQQNPYVHWQDWVLNRIVPFLEEENKGGLEEIARKCFPEYDEGLLHFLKNGLIIKNGRFKHIKTTGNYQSRCIGIIESITVATGHGTNIYEMEINDTISAEIYKRIKAGKTETPLTHCSTWETRGFNLTAGDRTINLGDYGFDGLENDTNLEKHYGLFYLMDLQNHKADKTDLLKGIIDIYTVKLMIEKFDRWNAISYGGIRRNQ